VRIAGTTHRLGELLVSDDQEDVRRRLSRLRRNSGLQAVEQEYQRENPLRAPHGKSPKMMCLIVFIHSLAIRACIIYESGPVQLIVLLMPRSGGWLCSGPQNDKQ
jgi:hypothetical protein